MKSEPAPSDEERLVVGLQPVREAIRVYGTGLGRVMVDNRKLPRLEALARYAKDQGVPQVDRVRRGDLDRLARGASHQGVACFAPQLQLVPLERVLAPEQQIILALDGIQDPQNFGAIIRSAVAIARAPILWPESSSAPLTPATFRASAGAIEHAQLVRVPSLSSALQQAVAADFEVIGLDANAPKTLRDLPLGPKIVLVLGAEHEGLGKQVRRVCTQTAQLLEPHHIDSLNVSVAAGIALFQASLARG